MMIERGLVDEDPVVGAYLEFIAHQMEAQPTLIRGLASLDRAEALVGDIEVDLDEDLGKDLQL
jgi:hypothetical protein